MTDNKVVQWKNSLAFNFSEIDFCTFVVSDECLELYWKQCARLWSWIAWFEEEKKNVYYFLLPDLDDGSTRGITRTGTKRVPQFCLVRKSTIFIV